MLIDFSPSAPAIWRQILRWKVDVWFCMYKPHGEQCTCEQCKKALDQFVNVDLLYRSQHDEDCGCDYCEPFSSFCMCEKCIPEDPGDSFQFPLISTPHSTDCKCYECREYSKTHQDYDEEEKRGEEERRIEQWEESLEETWLVVCD
jgi:hypothetical protein